MLAQRFEEGRRRRSGRGRRARPGTESLLRDRAEPGRPTSPSQAPDDRSPIGPAVPADASTIAPPLDDQDRREGRADLDDREGRRLGRACRRRRRPIRRARAATATLSAVPRSMARSLRCRGIVGRWMPARQEDDRQARIDQRRDPAARSRRRRATGPRSSSRTRAIRARSSLGRLGRPDQRQAIARRAGDQVERPPAAEHVEQGRRLGVGGRAGPGRRPAPSSEQEQVEAAGAGVGPHDAGHESAPHEADQSRSAPRAKTSSASSTASFRANELPDRRRVDLHLRPADADRPPGPHPVAVGVPVVDLDPLDPQRAARRSGRSRPSGRSVARGPNRQQRHPGRSGRDDEPAVPPARRRVPRLGGGAIGIRSAAVAWPIAPATCLGPLRAPRADGDLRPFPRQQSGDALADRPRRRQDGRRHAPRASPQPLLRREHGRGGRGVGAVGVEQDRDAERPEERLRRRLGAAPRPSPRPSRR